MNIFGRGSQVIINGKKYSGNNISINNGTVCVDGVFEDDLSESKITVIIQDKVDSISSDESITIKGNATASQISAGSSINCDNIYGNIKAGTSVNCDDIEGNVEAGTSINCDKIAGDARAKTINY